MSKKQLYIDEIRLLPVEHEQPEAGRRRPRWELLDDDRFVTGRGETVEFEPEILRFRGECFRRVDGPRAEPG